MPYPQFDRSQLQIKPLAERQHDMTLGDVLALDADLPALDDPDLDTVAARVRTARENGRAVVMLMGAHVIKQGLSRFVIKLLEEGWVTHIGGNGACAIHDYELALIGATTESVARYIREGQFGLWAETGGYNEAAQLAAAQGIGFGEALGKMIEEGGLPHRDVSIFAGAYRAGVPATVHVGIGYDILAEHPNFDGAAFGQASYRDFLIFTKSLEDLEGGVLLCYGSAVMGPEVYLKALSMVRNVAGQAAGSSAAGGASAPQTGRGSGPEAGRGSSPEAGGGIRHFTSAVFDLVRLEGDLNAEAPKDSPEYYYRPFKTILVRTVADGGRSYYIRGDHLATLPALHRLLSQGQ